MGLGREDRALGLIDRPFSSPQLRWLIPIVRAASLPVEAQKTLPGAVGQSLADDRGDRIQPTRLEVLVQPAGQPPKNMKAIQHDRSADLDGRGPGCQIFHGIPPFGDSATAEHRRGAGLDDVGRASEPDRAKSGAAIPADQSADAHSVRLSVLTQLAPPLDPFREIRASGVHLKGTRPMRFNPPYEVLPACRG